MKKEYVEIWVSTTESREISGAGIPFTSDNLQTVDDQVNIMVLEQATADVVKLVPTVTLFANGPIEGILKVKSLRECYKEGKWRNRSFRRMILDIDSSVPDTIIARVLLNAYDHGLADDVCLTIAKDRNIEEPFMREIDARLEQRKRATPA